MVDVGTSVFGLKYKDGVMVAADTSCTYGSMMKHKDFRRMSALGEEGIFACSGEMSDFQNLQKEFTKKYEEDLIQDDGACFMHPRDYHNHVARMQYNRRLKGDPILVTCMIAGINRNTKEVFLGTSDYHGTKIEADFFATGLGLHYCQVLLQNRWKADMSEADARLLIEDCMRTMFYRDKKAHDNIQISTVTFDGGV